MFVSSEASLRLRRVVQRREAAQGTNKVDEPRERFFWGRRGSSRSVSGQEHSGATQPSVREPLEVCFQQQESEEASLRPPSPLTSENLVSPEQGQGGINYYNSPLRVPPEDGDDGVIPRDEEEEFLDEDDDGLLRSPAQDLVCNGSEAGGSAICLPLSRPYETQGMDSGPSNGQPDCSSSLVSLTLSSSCLGDDREGEGDSDSDFDDYAEGEDGLLLDQLRERDPDPEDFWVDTSLFTEVDREEMLNEPVLDQVDRDTGHTHEGTPTPQGTDFRDITLNLSPSGSGGEDQDPPSLLGKMGLHFSSPVGDPVEVRLVDGLVYTRRKKVVRVLQQLASSINYGGKRGKREGSRRARTEGS